MRSWPQSLATRHPPQRPHCSGALKRNCATLPHLLGDRIVARDWHGVVTLWAVQVKMWPYFLRKGKRGGSKGHTISETRSSIDWRPRALITRHWAPHWAPCSGPHLVRAPTRANCTVTALRWTRAETLSAPDSTRALLSQALSPLRPRGKHGHARPSRFSDSRTSHLLPTAAR